MSSEGRRGIRTACPAGGVVEALQGHVDGIDGVGAGLDV